IIASKLDNSLPFVHIESPDNDGRIIYYYLPSKRCAEFVRDFLAKYGTYDLPVELGIPESSHIRIDGESVIRSIKGAFIGENIRLDGVVIGEIITPDVEIVCRGGKITGLGGIKAKPHGLE
ncbi:MAG: DUF2117 domain-containing protein, partial [Candidatus Methanoperedens sp.]|nr:DUF2117 domain-containing protein [Candidatus Methanoperedens sp.]